MIPIKYQKKHEVTKILKKQHEVASIIQTNKNDKTQNIEAVCFEYSLCLYALYFFLYT